MPGVPISPSMWTTFGPRSAAVEAARRYGFELVGEVIAIDAGPNQGRDVCYLQDGDGVTIEFIGRAPA
jgi:hypothetical protein